MDVSIIIVNYNTTALLQQCLAAIYRYTAGVVFEVMVVDNASADRSIEQITSLYPQVRLICNPNNQGFGAANNRGIALAKGEFIFLLNSDAFLQSNALQQLVAFMRQPQNSKLAFCGGELVDAQDRPMNAFGNFPSLLNCISQLGLLYLYPTYYRRHVALGTANYDHRIKEVDWISGADLFLRASALKETGAFDEDFFLYFEETELAWRLKKAGYRGMIIPAVKITHLEGGSSAETGDFKYLAFAHYAYSRDLYYRKTNGTIFAVMVKPLDILHSVLKTISGKEGGRLATKLNILLNPKKYIDAQTKQ